MVLPKHVVECIAFVAVSVGFFHILFPSSLPVQKAIKLVSRNKIFYFIWQKSTLHNEKNY